MTPQPALHVFFEVGRRSLEPNGKSLDMLELAFWSIRSSSRNLGITFDSSNTALKQRDTNGPKSSENIKNINSNSGASAHSSKHHKILVSLTAAPAGLTKIQDSPKCVASSLTMSSKECVSNCQILEQTTPAKRTKSTFLAGDTAITYTLTCKWQLVQLQGAQVLKKKCLT